MSTIAEQLQELAQIKEEIRQAIINKGVTVSSDAAFSTYATAIGQISGGGGDETLAALIDRSITSITIPSGVTKIGPSSFKQCASLASITIPNTVTLIDGNAFENCTSLTELSTPSSVTAINGAAFYGCTKMTEITIASGCTSIGSSCFSTCSRVTSIDLPDTMATIGGQAFLNMVSVSTIICRATTPPTVTANTFGTGTNNCVGKNVASGKVLYVPYGCKSAYESATSTSWVSVLLNPSICNFTIAELNADGTKPNS